MRDVLGGITRPALQRIESHHAQGTVVLTRKEVADQSPVIGPVFVRLPPSSTRYVSRSSRLAGMIDGRIHNSTAASSTLGYHRPDCESAVVPNVQAPVGR